jgi:hypothetical protein
MRPQDRRQFNRATYERLVHLRTTRWVRAMAKDLSIGGVGIVAGRPVRIASEVEIVFLDRSVAVLGVVTNRRKASEGYPLGVRFRAEERDVVEVRLQLNAGPLKARHPR